VPRRGGSDGQMTRDASKPSLLEAVFGRGASVVLAALACTPFEPGTDELPDPNERDGFSESSSTAALTPAQAGGDWSCLGPVTAPVPAPAEGAERIIYSVQILDFFTGLPQPGMQARACGLGDVECTRPVTAPTASDADGWLDVTLYAGFTGFLELTGPVAPSMFYILDPLTKDALPTYPYLTINTAGLEALGRALGIALDLSQGLMSFRTFDCQGRLAPGVKLTKVGAGVAWYFIGGLPSITEQRTGSDGLGGFLNIPPGLAQIDLLAPDGASITGPRSLLVRGGWFSSVFVTPPRAPGRSP
jgi:hypothetical protein